MTKIKKNDFVEIEFTGKDSNDNIFDTTNPKEAEEMGLQNPNVKPLVISIGNQMVLKGLDEDLEGKELNKQYSIHLQPEQAFGKRDPSLMRTYSLGHFKKQNINPYPGMALQLDNTIAKVISVSGGRVTMDFNNPLAGKPVDYNFKITKIITNNNEKINALQDFFFKSRFKFIIDEKSKKVTFKDPIEPFIEMFGKKFKDMTGFEFEVKQEVKKEEKIDNTNNLKQDKDSKSQEGSKSSSIEDTKKETKKETK